MTLEQRIIWQGSNEVELTQIEPGQSIVTNIRVVERLHLDDAAHPEFYIEIRAECSPDDSSGAIHIFNPVLGKPETRDIFTSEKPFFMIRRDDGALGKIEWEHMPSKGVNYGRRSI
jgi:hypothetical protein